MFRKNVWIPILIAVLFVTGCGLYYGRKVAKQEPITTYKPVEVETKPKPPPPGESAESGHWHGDVWHSEPHETHAPPPPQESDVVAEEAPPSPESAESSETLPLPLPPERDPDFVNPTSESSNPLFADGVPEHLQCPPEFIGVYSKEDMEGVLLKVMPIYYEVMEKWNPNRPIADLWEPMIAYEIWCRDNADPEKAELLAGQGRVDWLVQFWLDFPELTVLSAEDAPRYKYKVRVDMGDWSPDFNKFTLPAGSGRTFRTDDYKKYVFTWWPHPRTQTLEDGRTRTYTGPATYTTGPSIDSPNPEVIHIDLDSVSNEELEALKGWDYNINPYTTGAYKLGDNR